MIAIIGKEASNRMNKEQLYSKGYDVGYLNGYRCSLEDGWAKGLDAGVEWEAGEKMGMGEVTQS